MSSSALDNKPRLPHPTHRTRSWWGGPIPDVFREDLTPKARRTAAWAYSNFIKRIADITGNTGLGLARALANNEQPVREWVHLSATRQQQMKEALWKFLGDLPPSAYSDSLRSYIHETLLEYGVTDYDADASLRTIGKGKQLGAKILRRLRQEHPLKVYLTFGLIVGASLVYGTGLLEGAGIPFGFSYSTPNDLFGVKVVGLSDKGIKHDQRSEVTWSFRPRFGGHRLVLSSFERKGFTEATKPDHQRLSIDWFLPGNRLRLGIDQRSKHRGAVVDEKYRVSDNSLRLSWKKSEQTTIYSGLHLSRNPEEIDVDRLTLSLVHRFRGNTYFDDDRKLVVHVNHDPRKFSSVYSLEYGQAFKAGHLRGSWGLRLGGADGVDYFGLGFVLNDF